VTLVLDSSWRVLPCLNIGVSWSCRGLVRRAYFLCCGHWANFRYSQWAIL